MHTVTVDLPLAPSAQNPFKKRFWATESEAEAWVAQKRAAVCAAALKVFGEKMTRDFIDDIKVGIEVTETTFFRRITGYALKHSTHPVNSYFHHLCDPQASYEAYKAQERLKHAYDPPEVDYYALAQEGENDDLDWNMEDEYRDDDCGTQWAEDDDPWFEDFDKILEVLTQCSVTSPLEDDLDSATIIPTIELAVRTYFPATVVKIDKIDKP